MLDLSSNSQSTPESAVASEVTTVKKEQVVRRADGRKYVAGRDHPLPEGATIVCDTPHADGDFSYTCGSSWCRCME